MKGRYHDQYGTTYHKVPYIREVLLKNGFTEEELTDDFITRILEVRELMLKIYYKRLDINNVMEKINPGILGILGLTGK